MFQAVSPPIIRSSKTVHTASGICQACSAATASLGELEQLTHATWKNTLTMHGHMNVKWIKTDISGDKSDTWSKLWYNIEASETLSFAP
jgi:predicted carbohydrate-binding protein with CBM5 and CBM33 domain